MPEGNNGITRADVQSLEKKLHDIQAIHVERKDAQDKLGVDLGEKIEANHKAATDLMGTLQVVEKKQENYEKTLARQVNAAVAQDGFNYKEYGEVIRTQVDNVPHNFEYDQEKAALHKKAFDKYFKYGKEGMFYGANALSVEEHKYVNTILDPQGGFIVPPEYSRYIIPKVFDNYALLSECDRMTVGSGEYSEFLDLGDYEDSQWVTQFSATPTDTQDNQFHKLSYYPKEFVYPKKISRTALEDQWVGADYYLEKMRTGSDRQIAKLLWNGTGINEPRGLLTYTAGTGIINEVQQVTSADSGVVSWDDFLNGLPSVLKDDYQSKASYLMNRATFFSVLIDKDDNGRYQITNQVNFFDKAGVSLSLLGFPVKWDAGLESVSAGNLAVAFGDFSQAYVLVDRIGFSVIRDDTKPSWISLYLRRRLDAALRIGEAVKLLKIKS